MEDTRSPTHTCKTVLKRLSEQIIDSIFRIKKKKFLKCKNKILILYFVFKESSDINNKHFVKNIYIFNKDKYCDLLQILRYELHQFKYLDVGAVLHCQIHVTGYYNYTYQILFETPLLKVNNEHNEYKSSRRTRSYLRDGCSVRGDAGLAIWEVHHSHTLQFQHSRSFIILKCSKVHPGS